MSLVLRCQRQIFFAICKFFGMSEKLLLWLPSSSYRIVSFMGAVVSPFTRQ